MKTKKSKAQEEEKPKRKRKNAPGGGRPKTYKTKEEQDAAYKANKERARAKRLARPKFVKETRGKPILLTPHKAKVIQNHLRLGSWLEPAAAAAGIGKMTLYMYMKKGRQAIVRESQGVELSKEENLYARFVEGTDEAIADSELIDIRRLDKAAKSGIWQAAAWRLERRFPERWRQKQVIEHEGGENPIKIDDATAEARRTFLLGVIQSFAGKAVEDKGGVPTKAIEAVEVEDSHEDTEPGTQETEA